MSPEQLAASLEGGGANRPSSSRSTPHSPAVGSSSTGRKRSHAEAHRADSKGAHDHSKERGPSENANTDDAGDSDDDDPNGTDAKSRKKRSRSVIFSAWYCNGKLIFSACPQDGPLVQRVQGPFARLRPLQFRSSADRSLRSLPAPEQRRKIKVRISGRML